MEHIRVQTFMLSILFLVFCLSCGVKNSMDNKNRRIEADIKELMTGFIDESIAPGMALGYYSDSIGTIQVAVGVSDVEENTPLKTTTHYPIQSTSKMFISILILQLIEEGELTLESTIDEWVDEVPNSSQITIRHLLQHTSGLMGYQRNEEFVDTFYTAPIRRYSRDDIIQAGIVVPNDLKIGDWEYANTNYLLLANIIESVTGRSIGQELELRVFRSAGMKDTYYKPDNYLDTNIIVKCYRFGDPVDLERVNYLSNAAGGIVSNIEDMLRFGVWINKTGYYKLMAKPSELIETSKEIEIPNYYGLGIEVENRNFSKTMIGHSGGNPGLIHFFYFSQETGEIIIYFVNEGRLGKPFGTFIGDSDSILLDHR